MLRLQRITTKKEIGGNLSIQELQSVLYRYFLITYKTDPSKKLLIAFQGGK